jgi:tripartite-type tricarboxylate transporter receptor subunit TctC
MKYPGFRALALLALLVLGLPTVYGQAYPEKPIHLIVPYPPGGLTDASARTVAKSLSDRLRQPVVIENIAGGGGNIGADKAAKSPADGYTLYVGNNATVGINTLIYKKLPFDPISDFAPITLYAESQTILVVHPSLPVRNVAELIALAKSRPGQLNFGSTGTGGLSHLAGELFKSIAGVQMTHVPYKGTGPAQSDLLGGQIQLMFNDTAVPHVKAEKLRALAVTGGKRWPQLPDVPTFAELGIQGYETYNWFGILAPRGTPGAIIGRLNRELVAVMQEPAVQEWMRSRGAEPLTSSPEEFAVYIRKDLAKWARLVKEVGITAE